MPKKKYELWINASDHFLYYATDRETIAEAVKDLRDGLEEKGCHTGSILQNAQMELRRYGDNGYDVLETKDAVAQSCYELCVSVGNSVLRFETKHPCISEALEDLQSAMDSVGCVYDNFFGTSFLKLQKYDERGSIRLFETKSP